MTPANPRNATRPSSGKLYARTILACIVAAVLLLGLWLKRIERLPIDAGPLAFNERNAHELMVRLSKDFPKRVTWSDNRKKAAVWLKEKLRGYGYAPKGMPFSEVIAGEHYTDLENIYAEKRGARLPDEIVVVAAHYDVAETTVEGAMDDASGVGVVLELARVFANENSDRTLIFLLTDSEEFGAFWGAHHFARQFDRAGQIVAGINFDFVAPEKQVSILTLSDGLKEGYTPLWLREMALDSIRSLNEVEAVDFRNVMEHIQRAILIPAADHGEFLAAGIPAFNWVGQMPDFTREMTYYHHTPRDVAEAMRPESMGDFGKAAERLIRSLNALAKIPADFRSSSYWKVTRDSYVEGWVVTLLHLLAFVPFLALTVTQFRSAFRMHSRKELKKILYSEVKGVLLVLGAFLMGYMVMILLPYLHVIQQFENFPATQKSPLLYSPNFIAMICVAVAVGLVYWVFKKIFLEGEDYADRPEIRRAIHALLISIVIAAAMMKNTYLAVLLLLPPAYLWAGLKVRRRVEGKIINSLLIMGGALTFLIILLVMTSVFHIGVVYWYLFLAAAYGLISAYSVVLFLVVVAVMVRLFRNFVLR